MGKIHVHVVTYAECRHLILRYVDPTTGKHVRKSSGTASKTEARRLAHAWEADLNSGRDKGRQAVGWGQFRLRFEDEVLAGLAAGTGRKVATVFNSVEKALPRVATGKLTDLNAEALSRFQAALRDGKRSEATIASYLATLQSALRWAVDQGMIAAVPKIKHPRRGKKDRKGGKGKGRPLSGEEFDRMLDKVPAALAAMKARKRENRPTPDGGWKRGGPYQVNAPLEITPATVESWRHYLRGLWLSGLRLEESLSLYWDRPDRLCIDLTGKRPKLRIPRECEKAHQDRVLPITPDFAAFLLTTPAAERHGRVFKPMAADGVAGYDLAGRTICLIGQLAVVKVHTHPRTGKVKYASAHDLRRSYGNRWAKKVMPAVLQKLMRHSDISTTMGYYVDLDADELAEDLYRDFEREKGTVLGTVAVSAPDSDLVENGVTADY